MMSASHDPPPDSPSDGGPSAAAKTNAERQAEADARWRADRYWRTHVDRAAGSARQIDWGGQARQIDWAKR
jgi:hypothetical protein